LVLLTLAGDFAQHLGHILSYGILKRINVDISPGPHLLTIQLFKDRFDVREGLRGRHDDQGIGPFVGHNFDGVADCLFPPLRRKELDQNGFKAL